MKTPKKEDRCTGHCCRSFGLQRSPAQLQAEFDRPKTDPTREKDIDRLFGMLIYLGQFLTNPILETKGETWTRKAMLIACKIEEKLTPPPERMTVAEEGHHLRVRGDDPRGLHWYACRHVQFNGDCGIYEERPDMCRRYPNGQECVFTGCTWSTEGQQKARDALYPRLTLDPVPSIPMGEVVPAKDLTRKARRKH